MNIVKELNLNKTPNVIPNGSLVFAKNIKVSPDNSYITNEEGLTYALVLQLKVNSRYNSLYERDCNT